MSAVAERARNLLAHKPGGVIAAADVAAIRDGVQLEQAMQDLILLAAEFSRPAISGYRVGAVGLGASGALVLGANFEFAGAALAQTVHAEQCMVANAAAWGETGLHRIAISAAPCGHSRQFLNELDGAAGLLVTIPDAAEQRLPVFLPQSFGPRDLGLEEGLLRVQDNGLVPGADLPPLDRRAAEAANTSYAPYSRAPGGVAIALTDGRVFAGGYMENAAFNPSLPALQAAWAIMLMAGADPQSARTVAVCQADSSAIDHIAATRDFLAQHDPAIIVRGVTCNRGVNNG